LAWSRIAKCLTSVLSLDDAVGIAIDEVESGFRQFLYNWHSDGDEFALFELWCDGEGVGLGGRHGM
jgi:uncharacterized cupin superfamily protein